jgi:hypothetical protein
MATGHIDAYRRQTDKEMRAGNAAEHTHRPALKTLIESLASGVGATNGPKQAECGAPDFAITEKRAHGRDTKIRKLRNLSHAFATVVEFQNAFADRNG